MIRCIYASFALAAVYTLLSACFEPSAAALALPVAAVFTFFHIFAFARLKRLSGWKALKVFRKMTEYAPFVYFAVFVLRRCGPGDAPFALDLIAALIWVAISILSIITLIFLSEKRAPKLFPDIKAAESEKKAIWWQALEWVDALVQAACLVLLINLFFFQLYAIPSESMVPEFMIGDRVIVVKTPSGPRFPLSKVGIPQMRGYERGDIVVFRNPHYSDGKAAEVRSFVSQLVYMVTFTAVNINRDEFGAIKADPLVKRVTGLPGEKLMLVDGVLYARREGDTEFAPVDEDRTWAAWNLNELTDSQRPLVQAFPLKEDDFALLLSVESIRANLNMEEAAMRARQIAASFRALMQKSDSSALDDAFVPPRMEATSLFGLDKEIARNLLNKDGGAAWFDEFMAGWTQSPERANLFDRRSASLNVMLKLIFGRLVLRDAELILSGAPDAVFDNDEERKAIRAEAEPYLFYVAAHDQRNFGEFPAGEDEYIPDNCFFMMGDNRFNSIDMRHSYVPRLAPIDSGDAHSILYRSNLEPQYVPADKILGGAVFRFWPPSRIGVPE